MALRLSEAQAAKLSPQAAKTPVRRSRAPQKPIAPAPMSVVQSIVLDLPLPPTGCSPNNHTHGWAAGRSRAAYRAEVLAILPRVTAPMFERATIRTEWFLGPAPGRYHPRDEQNANSSLKAAVDAIVDAGIIRDDCAAVLHWGPCAIVAGKSAAMVRVTLERRV